MRMTAWCSHPYSYIHSVRDTTGQAVLHHLAGDGAPGGLRDAPPVVLSLDTDPATEPAPAPEGSTSLSQTSPQIWCFVHISHRSQSLILNPN